MRLFMSTSKIAHEYEAPVGLIVMGVEGLTLGVAFALSDISGWQRIASTRLLFTTVKFSYSGNRRHR